MLSPRFVYQRLDAAGCQLCVMAWQSVKPWVFAWLADVDNQE